MFGNIIVVWPSLWQCVLTVAGLDDLYRVRYYPIYLEKFSWALTYVISFMLITCPVHMSIFVSVIVNHGTISHNPFWKTAHSLQRRILLRVNHLSIHNSSIVLLPIRSELTYGLGNKKDNITVIYTPWSNLMKDGSMATGQVSFHNPKLVRKVLVRQRENVIVNRLNKTRVEKFPDLMAEKNESLKKKQREERKTREEQRAREKQEKRERERLKWQKVHAYDDLMSEENIQASSNQDRDPDFLDDFMWSQKSSFRGKPSCGYIKLIFSTSTSA